MLAIGLMSGTSVDGLDIALVEIFGSGKETNVKLIDFEIVKYSEELRDKIFYSFSENISSRFLCSLNFELANFYADSINNFLSKRNINNCDIDFIASHGQTIYHLVEGIKSNETILTLQLGDISVIANKTKIKTIGDFRTADVAVGGLGAPLVAYPDYLLFSKKGKIILLQNIGGMSNVTVVTEKPENVFAFDNGPGNVLIDFVMKKLFNKNYDKNGEIASKGKVNKELLAYLWQDDYYKKNPPKTTGREKYSSYFIDHILKKFSYISDNDIVTTITFFTAYVIYKSYKDFILKDDNQYEIFLSGGGANNLTLLKMLRYLFKDIEIKTVNDLGWDINAKEAIEFVVLGNQTLNQDFSNLKEVTGASENVILGKVAYIYNENKSR